MNKNNILADFPNIEGLINHPVHITGNMISSAFIPFCSFGLSMGIFGEELSDFLVPVCRLFREKIINGQVCYEADLNQFRDRVNWKEALSSGLTLIIDTNDEYDVKNIIEKNAHREKKSGKLISVFHDYKKDNSFTVMLRTISIRNFLFFISYNLLLRSCTYCFGGRGSLCSNRFKGYSGYPGVCWIGAGNHSLSDRRLQS